MNADRNLLFGILALQNDFVTRDQLVAAMNDWVLEKQTSLGEILKRRGALASDVFGLLDALVDRQIAKHQGDVQASIAALSSVSDARSVFRQIADEQVQATLRTLHPHADCAVGTEPFFSKAADDAGRFTILRPHAAGGLGEVFVARDNELDREVALKQIKEQYSQSGQQQARFKLEAEVTGGLEHPGIVPVYSLGAYSDGRPFYAMRFIRGDSLKEAIQKFHSRSGGRPDFASLEFRGLLRRFIDVCNAIAYAHSRGILHRDLKPGNIMLGKYGETLVVDWGLAKALGSKPTDHDASQAPLMPPSASGSGYEATEPGSTIGTPSYMSPEQAEGKVDQIGPATDVYSLGATLYSVLTGQPPFKGKSVVEILGSVRLGNFALPRSVQPLLPRTLEAVCLKAMSLQNKCRYATALELARDIENWLGDEPVSAWREPFPLRVRRWMRRHQVAVASIAAVLLIAVISLAVGSLLLASANAQTLKEKRRADGEKIAAIAAGHEARAGKAEAVRRRDESRRFLYGARTNLAHLAWQSGRVGQVRDLLASLTPQLLDGVELRGWEWHYLWNLVHQELQTLRGHRKQVLCVAFCSNDRLATGSNDGSVRLWDIKTGKEVWSCLIEGSTVSAIAFCPNRGILAAGLNDGTIRLRQASGGEDLATLRGHTLPVDSIVFHPNGLRLFSAAGDVMGIKNSRGLQSQFRNAEVFEWDVGNGTQLGQIGGDLNSALDLAISPDGDLLAIAGQSWLQFWDLRNRCALSRHTGISAMGVRVAFSENGKLLATAGIDNTVIIWSAVDRRELHRLKVDYQTALWDVCFTADNRSVVIAANDGSVRVWPFANNAPEGKLIGHTAAVAAVAVSRDGGMIASVGHDGTARIWSASALASKSKFGLCYRRLSFRGNSELAATCQFLGTPVDVFRFDKAKWQDSRSIAATTANALDAEGGDLLAFDPSSQRLAYIGTSMFDGSKLRVVAADSGKVIWQKALPDQSFESLNWSNDGSVLYVADGSCKIQRWTASNGHNLPPLVAAEQRVRSMTLHPTAPRLASAGDDEFVRFWDSASGQLIQTTKTSLKGVRALRYSPDGRQLVIGGASGMFRIWGVESADFGHDIQAHDRPINCIAFHPKGDRLAIGSEDGTVSIWDGASREVVLVLRPELGEIQDVAFSADGRWLAAVGSQRVGGAMGGLVIWDGNAHVIPK